MDLNDKIKKHNLLVEGLNDKIDNLLNEVATIPIINGKIKDIFSKYSGDVPFAKSFDLLDDEIKKTNDEIESGKETSSSDVDWLGKLETLILKLSQLEDLAKKLEVKKESQLPFKRVVIKFDNKVSLDIKKMKSPEFQRNLLGTMYFKVVGINNKENYMILKTKSLEDTMFIKLGFNKLESFIQQKGDVRLLYSKYKNPNIDVVEGEKEDASFKIIELS
jgi:hypothetical protein